MEIIKIIYLYSKVIVVEAGEDQIHLLKKVEFNNKSRLKKKEGRDKKQNT